MPAGHRKAGRPAPRARGRARVGRERPRGARGEGHEAGVPRGRRAGGAGEARAAERPQRRPHKAAAPRAMNRAFFPGARSRPGRPAPAVTQARAARSPPAHEPPAPPPFRPARPGPAAQASAGAWARPPRASSLRHRGSAGPAPPPLGPGAATLTRISRLPKGLRRRPRARAPVKSPSRQGLAASLRRRGRPAWSCVRHGPRLLPRPARPPALLPPPAPRNLRPLAFPPPLPALPAHRLRPPRGRARGGGSGRTAGRVRGGGAGKPPPPSPHRPERGGGGPETAARRAPRPGVPRRPAPARLVPT